MTMSHPEASDPSSPEFQAVLKALVDIYRPIIEEDLKRASDLDALGEEARQAPPDCEAELEAAQRLLGSFPDEQVVYALLPSQARELLGPIERWRWVLLHIRCCMIFGWLVCRRPRTFRLSAYYLYRYWLCVRQAVGSPVTPGRLTELERRDLDILVSALARAYRPFVSDQLASIDFPAGLADAVADGHIDCEEGEEEAAAVFERLMTIDTTRALLGEKAFEAHRGEPWFWFYQCWCMCATRFGCCLARAKNLLDVYRCLVRYWFCLRDCFRPLTCELTGPHGCIAEVVNPAIPALVVPIHGTAAGVGFVRYVLEWSTDNIVWHAANFVYPPIPPGSTVQGDTAVNGGLLAYLDTTLLNAGTYFVRLTVYGADQSLPPCGPLIFGVFKKDVRILGVSGNFTLDSAPFDPAARFIDHVPALCTRVAGDFEASFGNCLQVWGSAFVGGCDDSQKIKRYMLDYKPGYETDCATAGWTNFWTVEFTTAAQYRAINMRTDTSVLTANWVPDCLVPVPFPPYCLLDDPQALLSPSAWPTGGCQRSGLYTLRLVLEDTLGNSYCDTQRVWIDNKPITALIQIDAVPKCADLFVSQFALPPDCSVAWNLPLSGIAYDEYIDETLPLNRPNDNFDHYVVSVEKQGGPTMSIPITIPLAGPPCFYGTSRVGDPGTRCGVPTLPSVIDTLAQFDLRAIDPLCGASVPYTVPPGFGLARGECCVYIFHLTVYDRTTRACGGANYATANWPVKICNDLRPG